MQFVHSDLFQSRGRRARSPGRRREASMASLPGKVFLGPAGELFAGGQQGAARIGERVGDGGGRSITNGSVDPPRLESSGVV